MYDELILAIKEHDLKKAMELFTKTEASYYIDLTTGNFILHEAIEYGFDEFAEILINNYTGKQYLYLVNMPNVYGKTALHMAAENGKEQLIRLLINAKADLNILTTDGETAHQLAEKHGHHDLSIFLQLQEKKTLSENLTAKIKKADEVIKKSVASAAAMPAVTPTSTYIPSSKRKALDNDANDTPSTNFITNSTLAPEPKATDETHKILKNSNLNKTNNDAASIKPRADTAHQSAAYILTKMAGHTTTATARPKNKDDVTPDDTSTNTDKTNTRPRKKKRT